MPGPRSHGGWRRHIRIARNAADDAYGALPGALDWQGLPLIDNGMSVKATAARYTPVTNYGGDFRRHVAVHHTQIVEGDITTLLWPELTQYLFDMALLRVADGASPNNQDVYGHVIDHYTPDDPRRYYGAAVNTLSLACSGTGDNDAQLTLSMVAQREVENDALAETDPDYSDLTMVPFMAGHAKLVIDGVTHIDVEQWTLTVENNIGDAPFIWSGDALMAVRAHAIANLREVTLDLTSLNNDDRYNESIRDGSTVSFQATFTHPDGHIFQIILPSLYAEESPEDGTPDKQAVEAPKMIAQAAAAGTYEGEDIVYAVDLGPTTTTLAPITTTTEAATTTTAGE